MTHTTQTFPLAVRRRAIATVRFAPGDLELVRRAAERADTSAAEVVRVGAVAAARAILDDKLDATTHPAPAPVAK